MSPRKKVNSNMEEMVTLLTQIWSKNPGLRFCQLIGNCFDCKEGECYYIEDEKMIELLRKEYKIKE